MLFIRTYRPYACMIVLLAFARSCAAQADTLLMSPCVPDTMEVFTIVEEMPRFPGGEAELFKYLGKAMTYPKCPGEEVPPSTIRLSFIVRYDGAICGIEVKRGATCGDYENELRSMVLAMPQWEPGRQRGRPVNVQYLLPIRIHFK